MTDEIGYNEQQLLVVNGEWDDIREILALQYNKSLSAMIEVGVTRQDAVNYILHVVADCNAQAIISIREELGKTARITKWRESHDQVFREALKARNARMNDRFYDPWGGM